MQKIITFFATELKPMTGSELRKKFLNYFEDKKHIQVKSYSLVPHNDP